MIQFLPRIELNCKLTTMNKLLALMIAIVTCLSASAIAAGGLDVIEHDFDFGLSPPVLEINSINAVEFVKHRGFAVTNDDAVGLKDLKTEKPEMTKNGDALNSERTRLHLRKHSTKYPANAFRRARDAL